MLEDKNLDDKVVLEPASPEEDPMGIVQDYFYHDTDLTLGRAAAALNVLSEVIHGRNVTAGWWTDMKTGADLRGKDEFGRDRRNVPELLCLIHSEVSEAMEGYRKKLKDDKLPHRSMFEVELADVLIRIFDLAGAHSLDLAGATLEKLAYNQSREDHKIENRKKENGKSF